MTSTQVKEDCPHLNTQTLLQVEKFKDLAFSELKCKNCSEKSEIFICLFCGEAFCSKKIKSHFIEHNISNPEHCLFLEIINYSIWCNECFNTEQNNVKGCYIHSEKTDEYINIYKDYINKNNVNIYEFQLRPNFLLALYFSPDLFSYNNVINAINNVEKYLLRNGNNVMGLKTLDKTDKEYNGIFNKNDTNIFYTSRGFNIHNGIEHTWLYGIYLILKLKYFFFENKNLEKSTPDGNEDEINKIIKFASSKIIAIMNAIKNNKWFGLPEMSDELGNVIKEGNQSDLKSMAIFLELMDILSKLNEDNNNYYNINDNEYSNDLNDNSNIDI